MENLPNDICHIFFYMLKWKDLVAFICTCKKIHNAYVQSPPGKVVSNAWILLNHTIQRNHEQFEELGKLKAQLSLLRWTRYCQKQWNEFTFSKELNELASSIQILERATKYCADDFDQNTIGWREVHVEMQLGFIQKVIVKYIGRFDNSQFWNWQLMWNDKVIFISGEDRFDVCNNEHRQNMNKLHKYLGMSCELSKFVEWLIHCLPFEDETTWKDTGKNTLQEFDLVQSLDPFEEEPPQPPAKKLKMQKSELMTSYENFANSLATPLTEGRYSRWIYWVTCNVIRHYWTIAIPREWKQFDEDLCKNELLQIVKTYKVLHKHMKAKTASFSLERNSQVHTFLFDKVSSELFWLQKNQQIKLLDVWRDDFQIVAKLHSEWKLSCTTAQFAMFLQMCVPCEIRTLPDDEGADETLRDWFSPIWKHDLSIYSATIVRSDSAIDDL